MKEIIRKIKLKQGVYLEELLLKKEIFYKKTIAKQFSDYFINVGPNLFSNVQSCKDMYENFSKYEGPVLEEREIAHDESHKAFSSLRSTKLPGCDYILSNIVKAGICN